MKFEGDIHANKEHRNKMWNKKAAFLVLILAVRILTTTMQSEKSQILHASHAALPT